MRHSIINGICDRCQKPTKIKLIDLRWTKYTIIKDYGFYDRKLILCPDCWSEFDKWMKEENNGL